MTDDRQFEEHPIESVRERDDGYELTHDGGWILFCPKVEGLPSPQVGETLRTYGRGIGHTVRGIVINGRVYRYETEAESQARHEAWCREQEAKREEEFAANLTDRDRRIAALPSVFRERIEKFQRDGGHEFRRDYESYELFCCEQAVVIADTLGTVEAVASFRAAEWSEQKKRVPGLDDGHSGNTFGMACTLARMCVERPEFVRKMHGALTPLVGCVAYGCKHPEVSDAH